MRRPTIYAVLLALVLVVGCSPTVDPNVEEAIWDELGKPTGELTKADLGNVTGLDLGAYQLTDVKGLEKLTKLERLYLGGNPDLTKAQIAGLQTALPECDISSNPTK